MKILYLVGVLLAPAGPIRAAQGRAIQAPSQAATQPRTMAQPQQQQQLINLSVIDALVAIQEEGLAGFFGYIAEPNAAPAFAEYLFRTPKALKLFVKKNEQDLKMTGAINEWNKQVFLYIIGLDSNSALSGVNTLTPKMTNRVSALCLVPGLSLSEMTMRKKR